MTYKWPGDARTIAIYHWSGTLGAFRIHSDRQSFTRIPLRIAESRALTRRGYLVDLERHEVRDAGGAVVAGGYEQFRGVEWLRSRAT